MKPMHNRGQFEGRRRDDDMYDNDNSSREAVGNDLFNYNRRFSSDYANFDSEHAADYQRHSDLADEYRNIREGYYRNRGHQTGNSLPSQFPDAYGNRYGTDGDFSSSTRYNDQRYRPQPYGGQDAYSQHNMSGDGRRDEYRSHSNLAGYAGGSGYTHGNSGAWGDNSNQYGQGASSGSTSFRGKGPKSYVRSDERIREDVSDRLRDDEHIDASDIDVSVSGCEVTLSGTVESRFAKRHAEDLAESVSGVRNVENRIRVKSA